MRTVLHVCLRSQAEQALQTRLGGFQGLRPSAFRWQQGKRTRRVRRATGQAQKWHVSSYQFHTDQNSSRTVTLVDADVGLVAQL